MSFSPYSTMITVCVCFNSRVQLTVPSFTAWLRSRYSKALFMVLRRAAQEKDKGVCQGWHCVKKWACKGRIPGQPLQPQPLGPYLRSLSQHPATQTPRPQARASSRYLELHRSQNRGGSEFKFWFCYCLIACCRDSISSSGKWE
uniref:Putative uncharacterized protein encoded by LINC00173 n=1 Tax=Homo sapiens TaxID=9606 RepID=YL023_HUMAN